MHFLIRFITLFTLLINIHCVHGKSLKKENDYKIAKLGTPNGKIINIKLAISDEDQIKGLSGVKDSDFKDNQGMLFFYLKDSHKGFWMPNTYFNLDIYFLDKKLKILHIDRNVKAHPGVKEPPPIARTASIKCRHALELKASSKISKSLKVGDKFRWISKFSLSQIESKTRHLK